MMPDTRGPRFGAAAAENDTWRGALYGVQRDGSAKLLDARRATYGEAVADAYHASHDYGNRYVRTEGGGEYLQHGRPIYFR